MRKAPLAVLLLLGIAGVAYGSTEKVGDKTITKVVKLLQGMLEKSKEEGDEERKIYAKFKCYCDQSEASKEEAIAKNTKLISLLESEIEELQGSNGEASSASAELKASMADNKAKRDEATSVREKQNKQFKEDEADFEQAISQMKAAIETLATVGADQTKSTGADNKQFMAGKSASLLSLQSSMQDALSAAEAFMDPKQYQSVTAFLQAPFTGTYTSQSGAVMGIIKNMRDTFEANLADARAQEEKELKAHKELMQVLEDAFSDMERLYGDAQSKLGDNDKELSAKRGQLDQAEKEKANDEEFLEKLRPMCKEKAESYQERKVLRANEEAAIAEAVSILNSDSAFDTFSTVDATSTGATKASFLQIAKKHFPGVSDEDVRQVMQRLLRRAAAGHKAPRIAKVISTLQAENPFDTVLDEIDKMIKLIGEEGKSDKEKFDWCAKERKDNNKELKEKKSEILKLDDEIDKLNKRIDDPSKGLKAQIENTEISLQQNHESQVTETAERQEANKAYQADIKNLVSAESLLANALKVLNAYYDRFDSLLQSQEDPKPPGTWGEYEGQSKSAKSGDNSAISMLEYILKQTKKEEEEAHAGEEKDQAEYEDSMTSLKKEQANKEKSLAELQDKLAQAEEDLIQAEEDLKATTEDKEGIEEYLEKIKPGCDFIKTNFKTRETNRGIEKKALETAASTLKGSPAYKSAVADATVESYGKCKEPCVEDAAHVKCKACMADVTIPGYCAGHAGTPGC